ncbi:MAG TPA: SH3 domain-containing protein, partial [Thermomicrobiales bacterium]|nr:SH3 domain-containing protein [Thermomicrobiales bacterium]
GGDPVISGEAWTTSAVNLRSGPSTGHQVLRVVPNGAKIGVSTTVQNGFRYVNDQGQTGWMADAYIGSTSDGSQPDPVISGEAWTTSAVNLRSGPSTSNQVLRVVPSGANIGVSTTERSGFLYVSYQGQTGWMSTAYIAYRDGGSQPGDDQGGNYRTTTTALNLRAEPSTSAKILTVMPAGAKVQLLHTGVGSFGNVNYNGMQGWAALEYLQ